VVRDDEEMRGRGAEAIKSHVGARKGQWCCPKILGCKEDGG
jgi:hypothetical protein